MSSHPVRSPGVGVAVVDSSASRGPLRLVSDSVARRSREPALALELPLTGDWRGLDRSSHARNGLRLERRSSVPILVWETQLASHLYDELHVRMRVSRGERVTLRWRSDRSATLAESLLPLRPGDDPQTYRFALTHDTEQGWFGTITEILLRPSDQPADVEILSCELRRVPLRSVRRVGLGRESHEAMPDPLPSWRFTVPKGGVFETSVGFAPWAHEVEAADGMRLRWLLDSAERASVRIAELELDPSQHHGYQPVRIDLSDYEGRLVTLRSEVDFRRNALGDALWWANPRVRGPDPPTRNPVLLISIDTLRATSLSSYGYPRETSPHLDRFARDDAVLFERAFTEETYTLPAHMTMLTGLHPRHHGVDPFHRLREDTVTLAEYLRARGYTTAGFTSVRGWMRPRFGFADGFDVYVTPTRHRQQASETIGRVTRWLDEHPQTRPFLFVHFFDVHGFHLLAPGELPYGPRERRLLNFSRELEIPTSLTRPDLAAGETWEFWRGVYAGTRKVSEAERAALVALYDDAVAAVDQAIHELLTSLKRRGLYQQALIIVVSDHGESLGEHDRYGHGWVWDVSARVPLLVKFPGNRWAGARSTDLVQLADLYPTVLDVLGFGQGPDTDGASLLAVLDGRAEPRRWAYTRRQEGESVRSEEWKLIANLETGSRELYQIREDPGERRDRYRSSAEAARELEEALRLLDPSTPGWHFRWTRSPLDWRAKTMVRLVSASPMVRTERRIGDRKEWLQNTRIAAHTMEVGLHRIEREELVVALQSPSEVVRMTLDSGRPLELRIGDSERVTRAEDLRLDPGAAPPRPARQGHLGGFAWRSKLEVWYEPHETHAEQPFLEATEEQLEGLRALGYVD